VFAVVAVGGNPGHGFSLDLGVRATGNHRFRRMRTGQLVVVAAPSAAQLKRANQKSKGKRQKSKVKSQKSKVKSQKSKVKNEEPQGAYDVAERVSAGTYC
jgi:hypothetical protein